MKRLQENMTMIGVGVDKWKQRSMCYLNALDMKNEKDCKRTKR